MSRRNGHRGRPAGHWWENLTDPDPQVAYALAVGDELRRAQQVGEAVAEVMIGFHADQRPCPICGVPVVEHSRRQLRRCDNSRHELQVL